MPSLRRARREFLALSWSERGVFASAWLMLPGVALGLRVLGFTRMREALVGVPKGVQGRADRALARSIARLVDSAAHWSPAPTSCLVRSLVVCRLLLRRGLAADLRIGVAQPDGELGAHAWVEHDGSGLGEAGTATRHYTCFDGSILPKGT